MVNIVSEQIVDILLSAEKIVRIAHRNRSTLSGSGFYATKFSELHAEATLVHKQLAIKVNKFEDQTIKQALSEIKSLLDIFFKTKSTLKEKSDSKNKITFLYKTVINPAITSAT